MPNTLYVVGFPKSGNTWLTRLLADALQAPVVERVMRGQIEIASEVNRTLVPGEASDLRVAKVHFLPEPFLREVDPAPRRIVYIHRDIRDAAVSAFFYFTGTREVDVRRGPIESVVAGPRAMLRSYRARRRLHTFVEYLTSRGIPGLEEAFGTWDAHYRAWRRFAAEHPETIVHTVSYEGLLASTERALRDLVAGLRLPPAPGERIAAAVARQSFDALRRRYQCAADDEAIPLGKAFNLHFMRRGVAGDGLRVLPPSLVELIEDRCGDLLAELGYTRGTAAAADAARRAA